MCLHVKHWGRKKRISYGFLFSFGIILTIFFAAWVEKICICPSSQPVLIPTIPRKVVDQEGLMGNGSRRQENTDFIQYYDCVPVPGCGWLVCKAHQRESKSIRAVFTSLKLNTNKVLKKIRFCLRIFTLTKIQWNIFCCCFWLCFCFACDKNLGV